LQEIALVQGSQFLLTLPLLYNQTLQGCLIASGNGGVAEETSVELEFLAKLTASTLHHLIWVENAQRTLQNARQLVQIEHTLIDNLEEGIILLTPELLIAEMSPAAESMLGYATIQAYRQHVEMSSSGTNRLRDVCNSATRNHTQIGRFHLSTRTAGLIKLKFNAFRAFRRKNHQHYPNFARSQPEQQIRVKKPRLGQRAVSELSLVCP
jgi:PAS domain-containing protein